MISLSKKTRLAWLVMKMLVTKRVYRGDYVFEFDTLPGLSRLEVIHRLTGELVLMIESDTVPILPEGS